MTEDEEWLLMILAAHDEEPASMDELIEATGWDRDYLLERLTNLQELGYVDDSTIDTDGPLAA